MNNENKGIYSSRSLRLFFIIMILFSAVFEIGIIKYNYYQGYLFLMWSPAIAAFIALFSVRRQRGEAPSLKGYLSELGFRRCKLRYVFMGFLLPLIYLLIPYALFWIAKPESLTIRSVGFVNVFISMLISAVIGTAVSMASALGEEIGWRGFMLPALCQSRGEKRAVLISSAVWCVWHLPILIFGDYMAGASLWYKIPAFCLCIIPVGIIIGILTLEAKSVWPAAVLHAAHNEYDQALFGVVTQADTKMYFVSETGLLTVICAWVLALLMYRRYKKKHSSSDTETGEEIKDDAPEK